ncbi:VOC family protein [Streptomyces sp. NPDC059783]|uniref:VOC family protein n=1 Tax=Streptomyces sp. NPDC059783 TaxID=3346944 RepID=UPI00365C498E
MDKVSNTAVLAAIDARLPDWRRLAQPLAACFRGPDAVAAAAFVAAAARAAADAGHPVHGIRLGGDGRVDVTLCSVDEEGGRWITARDLELAATLSALARRLDLTAAPGEVAQLEMALDTADHAAAGPFWAALLGGADGRPVRDSVFDTHDRVPAVWFQQTDAHPLPRQRWHMDLWLAPEAARERIAAALAAGGTLVDDSEAPAFVVLADPEGNKACVCTALGRDRP